MCTGHGFTVSSAVPRLQMLTVPLLISLLHISSSSSSGLYCDDMPCALYHMLFAVVKGGKTFLVMFNYARGEACFYFSVFIQKRSRVCCLQHVALIRQIHCIEHWLWLMDLTSEQVNLKKNSKADTSTMPHCEAHTGAILIPMDLADAIHEIFVKAIGFRLAAQGMHIDPVPNVPSTRLIAWLHIRSSILTFPNVTGISLGSTALYSVPRRRAAPLIMELIFTRRRRA